MPAKAPQHCRFTVRSGQIGLRLQQRQLLCESPYLRRLQQRSDRKK